MRTTLRCRFGCGCRSGLGSQRAHVTTVRVRVRMPSVYMLSDVCSDSCATVDMHIHLSVDFIVVVVVVAVAVCRRSGCVRFKCIHINLNVCRA